MPEMITKNFSKEELVCKCCGQLVCDQLFIDLIQSFRDFIGCGIKVYSFYRCEKHNKEIGGAPGSAHIYGKAIDISVPGIGLAVLYQKIEKFGSHRFNGLGFYPDENDRILHLDNLERFARWCRINGKYYNLI